MWKEWIKKSYNKSVIEKKKIAWKKVENSTPGWIILSRKIRPKRRRPGDRPMIHSTINHRTGAPVAQNQPRISPLPTKVSPNCWGKRANELQPVSFNRRSLQMDTQRTWRPWWTTFLARTKTYLIAITLSGASGLWQVANRPSIFPQSVSTMNF